MPMFKDFVPEKVRPWLYVFTAMAFQLSGGVYVGAMNRIMGETTFMREDIMMCLYANLAGMAIWFPVMFRMKFRFTNKTLLTASAIGVILCNIIAPHISFLPLLWMVCFLEGICKLEGTFECMSNIQLWMTPKRDFTVFFPFLHIFIMGSIQISALLTTYLAYYYHWTYMNLAIIALMLVVLLIQTICTRHFRMMPKLPLYGIDWPGALLWAGFMLQVAFFFGYGQFYDWWNSPLLRFVAVTALINLGLCLWRMYTVRHPYYEPQMWKYRRLFPILVLVAVVEALLATEHVLEDTYRHEVMHYTEMSSVVLTWINLAGVLFGCIFAWWWMHIRRYSYLRLLVLAVAVLATHLLWYYFTISTDLNIGMLYYSAFSRGFSYVVLSATLMVCLNEIMTFQHFFQALSVFNMLHMVLGGVVGSAIYSRGLSYFMTDNIARYGAALEKTVVPDYAAAGGMMDSFMTAVTEISIKQLYGWAAYACLLLLLLFILYDAPVRRNLKLMPYWSKVRQDVMRTFRQQEQGAD